MRGSLTLASFLMLEPSERPVKLPAWDGLGPLNHICFSGAEKYLLLFHKLEAQLSGVLSWEQPSLYPSAEQMVAARLFQHKPGLQD